MNDEVAFRRVKDRRRKIDPSSVPESIRALTPFAERFGFSDYNRIQAAIQCASQRDQDELRRLLKVNRDELAKWLDENARRGPPYTGEHIAFSALRMLAEME